MSFSVFRCIRSRLYRWDERFPNHSFVLCRLTSLALQLNSVTLLVCREGIGCDDGTIGFGIGAIYQDFYACLSGFFGAVFGVEGECMAAFG